MKALLATIAVAVFALIGGLVYVGSRYAEPTVVPDPYESGLRYDRDHHAHDVAAVGPRAPAACQVSRGACTRPLGRATVTLAVEPRPVRPMRDLVFTVTVSPPGAAGAGPGRLALAMPGMYMGENRVSLAPAGDGRWQGRGVIVRCPSGGRAWTAEIELPGSGPGQAPVAASFAFEVAE